MVMSFMTKCSMNRFHEEFEPAQYNAALAMTRAIRRINTEKLY